MLVDPERDGQTGGGGRTGFRLFGWCRSVMVLAWLFICILHFFLFPNLLVHGFMVLRSFCCSCCGMFFSPVFQHTLGKLMRCWALFLLLTPALGGSGPSETKIIKTRNLFLYLPPSFSLPCPIVPGGSILFGR